MPNKTLYFHVGTHKTGTTSLQRFMHENRARLGSAGICYYGKCTSDTGRSIHHEFHRKLQKLRNDNSWHTLIVSDEDLSHNHGDVAFGLIQQYARDFDVRIVCYVREIVSYFISFYTYASVYLARESRTPKFSSLSEYTEVQDAYARNHDFLFQARDLLGKQSVVVRPYMRRRFRGGAIEDDFLDVIGCDSTGFVRNPRTLNNSPSLLQADKIYYLLRLTANERVRVSAAQKLQDGLCNDRRITITAEALDKIYKKYRQYELNIIQGFFGELGGDDVFDKTYSDWLDEISSSNEDPRLSAEEKQEVRDFVLIAQNEQILAHQPVLRQSPVSVSEAKLRAAGRWLKAMGAELARWLR